MLGKSHGTKEERESLRGEGDKIEFIDFAFERRQVVGIKKGKSKTFNKLQVLGMNDDLWDRARGLGIETWKGCE